MYKNFIAVCLTFIILIVGMLHAQEKISDFPVLKGSYLGQKPPGDKPIIFAEGIVSLGLHEFGFAVSPQGDEIFYTSTTDGHKIMHLKRKNDQWQAPEVASFSGKHKDNSSRFSFDGKKVYFSSNRPLRGGTDFNIWMAGKNGDVWSQAVEVGRSVNTDGNEVNSSIAENGNLYFQYFADNGLKSDLYYSPFINGKYGKPIKLPAGINTEFNDAGPFIAPNESYLMFHSDRPGGIGYMDLYISFKEPDGSWGEAKNLGDKINTPYSESGAYITPDKKYLFFSNYFPQNKGHIYWVDAGVIDLLK